jgi:hypothetical protein
MDLREAAIRGRPERGVLTHRRVVRDFEAPIIDTVKAIQRWSTIWWPATVRFHLQSIRTPVRAASCTRRTASTTSVGSSRWIM